MKNYRKSFVGLLLVTLVVVGGFFIFKKMNQSYSVQEVETVMQDSKSDMDVTKMPVEAKVKKIREVPLYGWATYVGNGMVITNFSKPKYEEGQTIIFYVTGCQTNEEAYLVNANVKY